MPTELIEDDVPEKCSGCGGFGKIYEVEGTFRCPRCKGTGYEPKTMPTELIESVRHVAELAKKATPGEWRVRTLPECEDPLECFVQAPRLDKSHPYDVEVLGDDVTLYPTKRHDAELIAAAHNLPWNKIVEALEQWFAAEGRA